MVVDLRAGAQRRWDPERGASLVEFALLLPVLACILLGMVTGGVALSTKNSMTNAVREGGRLGTTLPEGSGWTSGWAVDVKERVVELAGGDLEEAEVCVEIIEIEPGPDTTLGTWPAGGCPLSATAPSTPSSASDGSCVVKVWARTTATMNAFFFQQDVTLDADSVGLYERDCP